MAGAITAVTMPKWGIEMTSGTVNEWSVREGETVTKGQVLLQVETEKIVNDVESPAAGTLRRIVAGVGESHAVGSLIGVVAEQGVADAEVATFIANFRGATVSFEPDAPATATADAALGADAGDARVSPIARRLAERLGIDISAVPGTGRNGRISKEDVENFAASKSGEGRDSVAVQQPTERKRLSAMRATIARRLLESKQTIPHYRVVVDVAADALLQRKADLSKTSGVAISVNDLIVRAAALALIRHPALNVQFVNDEVLSFAHADVAIAVATEAGLLTPIVRAADQKSTAEIATITAQLIARAASAQLKREDLTGGTFTISNLGMFGVASFDAIINPPQVAILAIGAAEERIVARNGVPVVARAMTLTLCADHRVIDGAVAARFLATLRELLENPQAL